MTTKQLLQFNSQNLAIDLQKLYENEISDRIARPVECELLF